LYIQVDSTDEAPPETFTFKELQKESREFIDILNHGLTLLSPENRELKKQIITLLVKKTRTLEKLMELGSKHAVQSSLYDLEKWGFITRHIKENIYSYEFNRSKVLFKIQKDLETTYHRLQKEIEYYTKNDCLFICQSCKNLYDYAKAMENGFICCTSRLNSFDPAADIQKIRKQMIYIEDKLNSLAKL